MAPRLLALIPLAVGINWAMGQFVAATHLPVFLDTVGTVLVAALAGIGPALATGVLSQTALAALGGNVIWVWFLPVQLLVAALAGLAARTGGFASWRRVVVIGVGVGVAAAAVSAPIALYVFGGVTGGGVTVITTLLRAFGVPLGAAVVASSVATDVLDKAVTFLLVRSILIALPGRMAARFPTTGRALGRA